MLQCVQNKHESKLRRRENRKFPIEFQNFEIKPLIHLDENHQAKKKIFGFIQMKLEINSITREFENSVREKIKQKGACPIINIAKKNDIDEILYLYNRSFMTAKSPLETLSREYLEVLFDIPEVTFYIAKNYGIPAGFMMLDFEGDNKEYGFITALGIVPRFQGKGIGLSLCLSAWNHFKECELEELRCEVYFQNERSIGLLNSLKFQEFSIR